MSTIFLFLLGFVFLIVGADALVRGASGLAARMGIPPLIIGLTVVALGTSAPEFAVTLQAVLGGQVDLALGNVVGSNIFNVLFILGLSALIVPLTVVPQLTRVDVPLMIGASLLVWGMALNGAISRIDGLVLATLLVIYVVVTVWRARRVTRADAALAVTDAGDVPRAPSRNVLVLLGLMALGLLLLVQGARWLVDGAVLMARLLGVSELVIGLTVVAAGTALPEVATALIAVRRGQRDIAVGNVIGSNLFNLLGVLGVSAVLAPTPLTVAPAVLSFDIPMMVAAAVACLPIFISGRMISRWEGALFLGYYAAYTGYLLLAAAQHDALPIYSAVMLLFVIPLTVVTLIVVGVRSVRRAQPQGA